MACVKVCARYKDMHVKWKVTPPNPPFMRSESFINLSLIEIQWNPDWVNVQMGMKRIILHFLLFEMMSIMNGE